ncbi:hypothetical protein DES40_1614 [Litorimonas taeanensis]|uniref:SMODS-associating 2TM beta-strand rich effector domain-containing protein n=2 Tax=Litorimonas taeanensis TaxID=568099 RepID=A0A420WD32_9PROT|nr:hypothetical protein DES40_1614 [Litorimonas taeanensis]
MAELGEHRQFRGVNFVMNRQQINSASAFGTSLILAATSVILAPKVSQMALLPQIIYALFATIGFYSIFTLLKRGLTRYYLRGILGKWYYVTAPFSFSSFKDANYAVMTFYISAKGNLDYKVDLYPTRKGLEEPGSERSRGHAYTKSCRYHEADRKLDLVFNVNYAGETGQATRDGRLFLRFVEAGHLEGDWVSEVSLHTDDSLQERQLSTGRMIAARPDKFFEITDKALKNAIDTKV